MPWYQALLILGSVALLLIVLIRPSSDGRRMAFTLLNRRTSAGDYRLGAKRADERGIHCCLARPIRPIGQAIEFPRLSRLRDCRLLRLKHAQPVDAVERCHPVALRQGRVIEHGVDEVVDRPVERQHRLTDVDQLARPSPMMWTLSSLRVSL